MVNAALDFRENSWRPQARAAFDQLQRAALSVQLNIAEGYARKAPKQFLFHLQVAYGSAVETTELIELLQSRGLVPREPALAAIQGSPTVSAVALGTDEASSRAAEPRAALPSHFSLLTLFSLLTSHAVWKAEVSRGPAARHERRPGGRRPRE